MRIPQRIKIVCTAFIALGLLLAGFPLQAPLSYAALPSLDQIRVSLFIDQRGTVPSVTLSSANGLNIGVRLPDGAHAWIKQQGSAANRFTIDQYMLKWLVSADSDQARTIYNRLDSAGYQPYIFKSAQAGKPVYQVYTGQYASLDEANRAAGAGGVGLTPVATGPLHWSAGTFPTAAAADQQLQALENKGIDAFIAVFENAGKPAYGVWFGEAATQAQLDDAKRQALKALPSLAVSAVDGALAYLMKREDVSAATAGNDALAHWFFNGAGEKVWVSPGGTGSANAGIKVNERYERTYRGGLEISRYNGSLAVINVLPFEQYLYAVVGSELGADWPLEALKAQAVAARTYALTLGMKYGIANISDTTYDQAYHGLGSEFANAIAAVDQTKGQVLVDKQGSLITPYYYANSGGVTADPLEIWGAPIDYIKSVPSPDQDAQNGKLPWDRVVLPNGAVGYIRSDFVQPTGRKNPAGLNIVQVTEDGVNIRQAPYVDNGLNGPIAQANSGDQLVVFDQAIESNAFSWIRGPFTSDELLRSINGIAASPVAGPLRTLTVAQRGASGRVMKMQANGKDISLSRPDNFRSAMNDLPSTRFDVEETGRYTVLGAGGAQRELPAQNGELYVMTGAKAAANSGSPQIGASPRQNFFFMNGSDKIRFATREPGFRFVGLGSGHGLGMSQWGAKALAELQDDYTYILQYYYKDVSIVKE